MSSSDYKIVAAPKASIEAAAKIARAQGYRIEFLGDSLEGEAREVAKSHAAMALDAKRRGEKVAIMSGGELTVTVKGNGSGGPNQEYALGLTIALDGAPGISGLAGDTDGIDGGGGNAGDPAGALVFPDTLKRALAQNLNAAKFLENNDSTGYLPPDRRSHPVRPDADQRQRFPRCPRRSVVARSCHIAVRVRTAASRSFLGDLA